MPGTLQEQVELEYAQQKALQWRKEQMRQREMMRGSEHQKNANDVTYYKADTPNLCILCDGLSITADQNDRRVVV